MIGILRPATTTAAARSSAGRASSLGGRNVAGACTSGPLRALTLAPRGVRTNVRVLHSSPPTAHAAAVMRGGQQRGLGVIVAAAGTATATVGGGLWLQLGGPYPGGDSSAQCEGATENDTSKASATATRLLALSPDQTEEPYSLAQKCLAEAIGTATIVLGGCGAVCASKFGGAPLSLFNIAAAFGTSVALAVYATRDVSGAHLNPAITASLAVHDPDGCPPSLAGPYVLAQCAGAAVAGGINYVAYRHGIAALHVAEKVKVGTSASSGLYNGAFHMIPNRALIRTNPGALAVEVGLTTCLAFMVYALTDVPDKTVPTGAAPALVGATVAALVVPGAPLTGCGMNPARDLGPRLVAAAAPGGVGWKAAFGAGSAFWVYTIGPVLGGVAGGYLYKATLKKKLAGKQEE